MPSPWTPTCVYAKAELTPPPNRSLHTKAREPQIESLTGRDNERLSYFKSAAWIPRLGDLHCECEAIVFRGLQKQMAALLDRPNHHNVLLPPPTLGRLMESPVTEASHSL